MRRWLERVPNRRANLQNGRQRRRNLEPIELPPRAAEGFPRRANDPAPRLVAETGPGRSWPKLVLRTLAGSLGLALLAGIAAGRLSAGAPAGEEPRVRPAGELATLRVRGAGHLANRAGALLSGPDGFLRDVDVIRDRLLATDVLEDVSVERRLASGEVLVEAEEKRAVALLDWEPPHALAADGAVLGPATAGDLDWAGAADLVLVAGVPRAGEQDEERDAARAALAGRVAAALRRRPALDRLVSVVDVRDGPFRIRVTLRSGGPVLLLTEGDFLKRLEHVAWLLPDLLARWPELSRVDARVPDRLLLRAGSAADGASPANGGTTE